MGSEVGKGGWGGVELVGRWVGWGVWGVSEWSVVVVGGVAGDGGWAWLVCMRVERGMVIAVVLVLVRRECRLCATPQAAAVRAVCARAKFPPILCPKRPFWAVLDRALFGPKRPFLAILDGSTG